MVRAAEAKTDGDLVALALVGDAGAFARLYRSNVAAVSRVVRDNVADQHAAADLVQEVFTRALERLSGLREPDRFRPWLLAIARHAVVDRHRSRARTSTESLDDESSAEPVGAGPSTEELAELADLARLVAGCVGDLSSRDASAISLVTHLGFGPDDLAAALGVTTGTAKVIVHRARRRLRDALALELMVRRQGRGCPAFEALDRQDVLAGVRHVHACPECADLVQAEVALYGTDPVLPPGPAGPVLPPGPAGPVLPPGPAGPAGSEPEALDPDSGLS